MPSLTFRSAESALRKAQLKSDVEALDTLIDDALVFVGPDGALYGKQDDLAAHRSGAIRIERLDPSEERIQEFADIVIVSVRMEMRGTLGGAPFVGPFRYTRIWRHSAAGWRIVAGHVSAIASPSVASP
jgi:ketosteroid isomerase-like protein